MEKKEKSATLKQVALEAGVSTGTVDRILHNRGRFSAKTQKKVLETIKRLGFSPDIGASMLSRRTELKIAVLLPYFQNGDFWSMLNKGVQKAAEKYKNLKLNTNILYYNQFDEKSFDEACDKCIVYQPDAAVLSPIMRERSAKLANELYKAGTPTIFVDTKIDDCPYWSFRGIDLERSAYILADMIFRGGNGPRKMFRFDVDHEGAPQGCSFLKRNEGLERYMENNRINCEIIPCTFSKNDFLHNVKLFDDLTATFPGVRHGLTMTSRASIIADWLDLRGIKNFRLYGFDATPANVRALKSGYIDILISQRTAEQIYDAIDDVITYLITGIRDGRRDICYPIDILTRFNVDFYRID